MGLRNTETSSASRDISPLSIADSVNKQERWDMCVGVHLLIVQVLYSQ